MTSHEIRQQFIDFFKSKAHDFVPSSPVVPLDDPTLMFTNAGMNQFKPIFLGTADPRSDFARLKRVANTQKCIRAGGKHNDLDDVGQDTYHHTFFEMLGNWSFGDYFKKEAIEWAWELLTKVWGIDKSRLHATYFQGDSDEGLEPDREAAELWRARTDINPKHIHPGNKKDNFWEMGDTGPCGPCSEIHIDLTPDKSGAGLVNKGDARVMEVWNLVFIQYNRGADGKLTPLPAKHVDTGMGFERICSVLQGARAGRLGSFSNYDTDVFTPVFRAIQKRAGAPDYRGTLPTDARDSSEPRSERSSEPRASARANVHAPPTSELSRGLKPAAQVSSRDQIMVDVTYRVIADHIRTLTFALTDGAMPSNEGRGYVLRRILRRAVRYGRQYFNMHEPFLCDLVAPLVEHMGGVFPELRKSKAYGERNAEMVAELIRDEEASFLKTLDRGIRLFTEAADAARRHHHGKITGEDAFKLHDTFGFPIDLTELMAEEQGLTLDFAEYERLLDVAKEKSRGGMRPAIASGNLVGGRATVTGHITTDDSPKYESLECDAVIRAVVVGSELEQTGAIKNGTDAALVLDRTCFYAEQGGQVGDVGVIRTAVGTFEVRDTQRVGGSLLHIGVVTTGSIACGETAHCTVDPRRRPTMQNHTATHLLNWALREVLGEHVQQKGSLVDPEKTRFDFSHNKAIEDEQIKSIEDLVNNQIALNHPVYTQEVDQKKALRINTLRAVFGEKYPDRVRVVSIGAPIGDESDTNAPGEITGDDPDAFNERRKTLLGDPDYRRWMDYSVEFCGGTHVANTGEIGAFVLTHEEAVAKGVRRLVGVSGDAARGAVSLGEELLAEAMGLVASPPADLPARLAALQRKLSEAMIPLSVRAKIRDQFAELQKLAKQAEKQQAASSGDAVMTKVAALLAEARRAGDVTVVVGEVPSAPVDALRRAIDWIRQKTPASAVLLACLSEGKVTLLAGMSKAVVDRGVKAGDLIKDVSPIVGGKGGGRPDMAQGGGPDAAALPRALESAEAWIKARLS